VIRGEVLPREIYRFVAGRRCCDRLPEDREGGLFRGTDVYDRKRLYQPEAAPIPAPKRRVGSSPPTIRLTTSEAPPFELDPDPEPAEGVGLAGAGLAEGVPLDAGAELGGVDARTVRAGVGDAAATELACAEGLADADGSRVFSLTDVIRTTARITATETSDARRPASQVDLGARKPASIGGRSGTGRKMKLTRKGKIGSLVASGLPTRAAM
jgi:hypothetical protein